MNEYLTILSQAWQDHLAPKPPNAPTVISTFAGGGGSSLGYSMAGYRELLAVEWDDNAVAVLKANFPHLPIYHGDIANLSVEQVFEMTGLQKGELDVFDGSPPCQGFSTSGKRQLDDPRNGLFKEFVRLLDGLQPKVFVMENVSGMVKGKMKLVFVEILKALKDCGYKVSARLLNAMYFHVPQSRQRMIFIGVRSDLNIEPSYPTALRAPFVVRDAIEGLTDVEIDRKTPDWATAAYETIKPLDSKSTTRAFVAAKGTVGGSYNSARLAWDKPSPTIPKAEGGTVGLFHPSIPRWICTQESARLQSFPDDYIFLGSRVDKIARIGNSVPPLFMRAVANHIKTAILVKCQESSFVRM